MSDDMVWCKTNLVASDTFMVGATPMSIRVYPNGYSDKHKGNVSVVLWNLSDAALSVSIGVVSLVFVIGVPCSQLSITLLDPPFDVS